MFDICCIGHISQDKVVTPQNTVHMPGGTAFYFSKALQQLPLKYVLVTAVAPAQMEYVEALRQDGIQVSVFPSQNTVCFENIYPEDFNYRTQNVLQKADPFHLKQLEHIPASIYHMGALLADDIPPALISALSNQAIVSLDVQGYLRKVENQHVLATDWPEKKDVLKHVHILKTNEEEARTLTGSEDIQEAARIMASWGVKEVVMTMGSMGSLIYAEGTFYEVPAYAPAHLTDATGCGDTYMAGYLSQRVKGISYLDAGKFAAAMASLKIETSGPFYGSSAQVETRIMVG